MKKVRIMLVAIAVLGTVGGALAFKAKKFGDTRYCVTTVLAGPFCPVLLPTAASFSIVGATTYRYTTVPPQGCTPQTPCTTTGRFNP